MRAEETPDAAVPALLLLLAIAAGRGEAGGDEPGAERRRHGRRHCSRPGSRERYEDAGQLIFGGGGGDAVASTGPKNRGGRAEPPRCVRRGRAGERSRGGWTGEFVGARDAARGGWVSSVRKEVA